jgi:dihydrofolate reductase
VSAGVRAALQPPVAIVLLAAVADNGVIGRDNALPFRQSSDLKRFKALTMGKPVLMGRKTYRSIGRPLPGRTNIVMSRDPGFAPPGVLVAADLECALDLARADAEKRGAGEIVVIGGTGLFEQIMPLAERMEITHVHAQPEGDTYFPPIDAAKWRAVARADHPAGPQDEASFSYVTYARA